MIGWVITHLRRDCKGFRDGILTLLVHLGQKLRKRYGDSESLVISREGHFAVIPSLLMGNWRFNGIVSSAC
jgi:hypothetical protein